MKKKNSFWICHLVLMGMLLIITSSCKKKNDNNNPTPINGIIFNPNLTYGTMTDIDGNVYKTITIGTQTWMAENLKTTRFNDGTPIPLVTDNTSWTNLTTPGYCWYNNDAATYKSTYGALYNWYTVDTGKLCPIGWHVPTYAEWTTLMNYLGVGAGGKLKEIGFTHWQNPNTGATNVSGFTALPAGVRSPHGDFYAVGSRTSLWSSSESNPTYNAWTLSMSNNDSSILIASEVKNLGYSVRLVR